MVRFPYTCLVHMRAHERACWPLRNSWSAKQHLVHRSQYPNIDDGLDNLSVYSVSVAEFAFRQVEHIALFPWIYSVTLFYDIL